MTSSDGASTVLTAWTGTLLRALAERDVDVPELLATVGLDDDLLADPDRRIPLAVSTRLWRAAVEVTGDDAVGIDVSRHVRPATFHALGSAFLSSRSLRAALERTARYTRVTADVAVGSTRLVGSDVELVIGWRTGAERPAVESVDAALAAIVRSARFLLGRDTSPTHVDVERPEPANLARFERFFRCPVRFSAPENVLAFDRSDAERPVPGGNEALASVSEQALTQYLDALEPDTIVDQVRAVLVDALDAGAPDIAVVADELAMSRRTLQRRLDAAGTSYRDVLADTRRQLAETLLAAGDATVTEIAHRLGFSETAAFSRAYRRWTGSSPSEHRGAPPP